MNDKIIRKRMQIYGSVQGVGFRYRARCAADALGITGWVKNEWDGSVRMEAQGTKEQLDRMLGMIAKGTFISIDRVEERELSPEESEKSFRVRGY